MLGLGREVQTDTGLHWGRRRGRRPGEPGRRWWWRWGGVWWGLEEDGQGMAGEGRGRAHAGTYRRGALRSVLHYALLVADYDVLVAHEKHFAIVHERCVQCGLQGDSMHEAPGHVSVRLLWGARETESKSETEG